MSNAVEKRYTALPTLRCANWCATDPASADCFKIATVLGAGMKNQDLVDYLKQCGVCQVCQLRYLKARGTEYRDRKDYFERQNVSYEESTTEEQPSKKPRLGVCPTCLGLFSVEFQQQLVEGILATDMEKFECDSIVLAVSLPILLQIRQLSMWYALQRKFDKDISADRAPDVPLKEAVKLILNPTICEQLKRSYDANGLMISISLKHSQEQEEIARLAKLNMVAFPAKNGKIEQISRGLLEKKYTPQRISAKLFEQYLPIPPTIPDNSLSLESITLTGPPAFVAGRYRKISRELSHTPWVLNGSRVMDDSIEEIIIRNVAAYFRADPTKIVFMSSGREDVDVRCLGPGRPFVLEIPNSQRFVLSSECARKMEAAVDQSLKVSVRDLQMVQRDDLVHIKMGEEQKRKYYRALCELKQPVTVATLEQLNLPAGFEIQQKTPIRVLHRRPLHTRPRMIYSLRAQVCPRNARVLVLDIVSQAGTYIKELVHGEFGRTAPSIAALIGQPIDIIALDVVGIDLDWPPVVNSND